MKNECAYERMFTVNNKINISKVKIEILEIIKRKIPILLNPQNYFI